MFSLQVHVSVDEVRNFNRPDAHMGSSTLLQVKECLFCSGTKNDCFQVKQVKFQTNIRMQNAEIGSLPSTQTISVCSVHQLSLNALWEV